MYFVCEITLIKKISYLPTTKEMKKTCLLIDSGKEGILTIINIYQNVSNY